MSLRNRLALLVIFSVLALLAGCGSSGPTVTPPPSGGFSNSNMKGTYVVSFAGEDALNATYFSMMGALAADGNGGISSGTVDINDGACGAISGVTVGSGSSYSITADGRGRGTLNTNVSSSTCSGLQSIAIDFVLTSSSHGLIIRADGNGTGSGTLDLQSSSLSQSSLTSYAFSLSGLGANGFFGTEGEFALGGGTTITSGLEDFNDANNSFGLTNLPLAGSVTVGSSGSPGTASLTATGSPYGTLTFDVWPIDATHLKLIETDGSHLMQGDAFTQQTTVASGQLVYTLAGIDNAGGLFSSGGFMSYDGSNVISNGLEDINDNGTTAQSLTVAGSLTATGSGRYTLTLGGLYNGINGSASTYTFVGYPFTSGGTTGVFVMETDGAASTAGTLFSQSAETFASSAAGYGLNLTGVNSAGEVDAIAEFTANSGGTLSTGIMDENDAGSFSFKESLGSGATYTFDSPATGRGSVSFPNASTGIGALNLEFYVVDSSNVIFIDGDSSQVAAGSFEIQSTPTKASLSHTQNHLSVLRAIAKSRIAKKK